MYGTAILAASTTTSANHAQLVTAALLGIATVVLLITWLKVHPFIALIIGSAVLGLIAGYGPTPTVTSFTTGFGSTFGAVGLLVALGAMIGKLLGDTGGANQIVDTVVARFSGKALPWAIAGVAALIGLPMFFEIGVVLLVPIVLLVAKRSEQPVLRIGIPALAGLSVLHGLVPPHPGPLAAIANLKADLGLTLLFGLIIAVPTVIVAGPIFGSFISARIPLPAPEPLVPETEAPTEGRPVRRRPSFLATVLTILLPVAMMLLRAYGELVLDKGTKLRAAFDVIGTPSVALLAGVVVAMFTLGFATGRSKDEVSTSLGDALPPIASILLIVAAGGGFKQTLVDAGVGNVIADAAKSSHISPLVLGWLVAVGIRLATGSATVATITAAGIVAPLAASSHLDKPSLALLALAVGSGSLFFSHVNDAGFWLVKEYFKLSVGQTIASWSVMETIISVMGLGGVLLLHLVV